MLKIGLISSQQLTWALPAIDKILAENLGMPKFVWASVCRKDNGKSNLLLLHFKHHYFIFSPEVKQHDG